ncbi:MAG: rhomboid family intramembrane serine protease [Bacteroidota bacterium]
MNKEQKSRLFTSLFFPILFVAIIWLVKVAEIVFETNFAHYGIFPRKTEGLIGILFYPLIHSGFNHLINNTTSLLILGIGIFHFYRPVAYNIYFLTYIMSGIWIWVSARESYHIGASGLIYGFASFIFLSGIIRRNTKLLALSLLVTFLYGGMVWGIFPIRAGMSWEGHLWGSVAGVILAFYYRNIGPVRKKYSWELEEESNANIPMDTSDTNEEMEEKKEKEEKNKDHGIAFRYIYKPKNREGNN